MAKATVIDRVELTRRRMALREKLTAEPNDLSPTTELRGLISDLDKIRGAMNGRHELSRSNAALRILGRVSFNLYRALSHYQKP